MNRVSTTFRNSFLPLAIAFAALCGPASTAQAANDPMAGYSLVVTTDLDLLQDPHDHMLQMFSMWKTATQMEMLRSAPYIRLTNTGEVDITGIRIDINDPSYMFDSFVYWEQPDSGIAANTSHATNGLGGEMHSYLQFWFPGDLHPGDSFTFQVNICPTAGLTAGLGNFEKIFWDQDQALTNPNVQDNAHVLVAFDNTFLPMVNAPFFEYAFANRTYSDPTTPASGFSMGMTGGVHMESVGVYELSQFLVVPEPQTATLLAVGLSLLGLRRWRRAKESRFHAAASA